MRIQAGKGSSAGGGINGYHTLWLTVVMLATF